MSSNESVADHARTSWRFVAFTLSAAVVASLAAWATQAAGLDVWVMFVGFIAWFTRPTGLADGLAALVCLLLGIGLGAAAFIASKLLSPTLGAGTLAAVVFVVAIIIVGLRTTPVLGNMLAWFLGLVTFFAAHRAASFETLEHLALGALIGGLAGWACQAVTQRWAEA